MNPSNRNLRWPRTTEEAGWRHPAEYESEDDRMTLPAIICWGLVGAVILWLFLVVVLS